MEDGRRRGRRGSRDSEHSRRVCSTWHGAVSRWHDRFWWSAGDLGASLLQRSHECQASLPSNLPSGLSNVSSPLGTVYLIQTLNSPVRSPACKAMLILQTSAMLSVNQELLWCQPFCRPTSMLDLPDLPGEGGVTRGCELSPLDNAIGTITCDGLHVTCRTDLTNAHILQRSEALAQDIR